MLTGALDAMRRERAKYARDVEYIRTMMFEDALDDREEEIDLAISGPDDPDEIVSAVKTVEQIPEEDDFSDDEVDRILASKHDLSFDEMIGCDNDECGEECGSCDECGDKNCDD